MSRTRLYPATSWVRLSLGVPPPQSYDIFNFGTVSSLRFWGKYATVVPRYNAPRYNADPVITFDPNYFLPSCWEIALEHGFYPFNLLIWCFTVGNDHLYVQYQSNISTSSWQSTNLIQSYLYYTRQSGGADFWAKTAYNRGPRITEVTSLLCQNCRIDVTGALWAV